MKKEKQYIEDNKYMKKEKQTMGQHKYSRTSQKKNSSRKRIKINNKFIVLYKSFILIFFNIIFHHRCNN